MGEIGPAATLSILVKAQGVQATSAQLGALDKTARTASGGLATTEKHAKRSGAAFSAMGTAAKSAGLLVGAAGLAAGIKTAVGEFREAQKTGAQTTAVLKSTGNAAKVTKKHIEDLAGSISKKSGIDDEAIQTGANLLLTFKGIRNEQGKGNKVFDQATQVITDMSVSLKQGLKPSAIQVGKALNDPVKGITALGRVGVQFTEAQKKQIAGLVEHGDKLGAQKIILKELKSEFAGSAAAQATAGDKLKVAWGNLAEAAGSVLVPALDKVATFLTNLINQFIEGKGVAKVIIPVFVQIRDAIASALPVIAQVVDWFGRHKAVAIALVAAIGLLVAPLATLAAGFALAYAKSQTFRDAVDAVVKVVLAMPAAVSGAFNAVKTTVTNAMNAIVAEIRKWDVLKAVVGAAVLGIVTVVKAALQLVAPVFTATFGVIKAIVTGAFNAMKAIVQGGLQVIRGVIQVFGGLFKGDFGQVWEGVKDVFRGGIHAIKGILTGEVHTFASAATAIGDAIGGAFTKAWDAAKATAVGFINAIIDIINKIPGVNIGHVGGGGGGKGPGNVDLSKSTGALARGGAFGMTGGTVNKPMVMMGEEAPRYPEFVIPTNPAYRGRAQGLLAQAAGSIGMASGGVVGDIVGGAAGLISGGAGKLLGKLPGVGQLPGWMQGTGKYVLAKAGGFIKDKVGDLVSAARSVVGGGGGAKGPKGVGSFSGVPMANWVIDALKYAQSKGVTVAPTSGYRPGFDPHTKSGRSEHQGIQYPHGAVDFGGYDSGGDMKRAVVAATQDYKYPLLNPIGFHDEGHASGTGHRMGGVIQGLAKGGVVGGSRIGVAIAAARKAGFTGEALVRMVAIAGRESNYNPRAANYKPPDHSIGLWQINQLAHHGRFGTDAELMNPDTNAHAAWVLSSGGKNFGPWSTNRGLSAGRIEAARKAIAAGQGAGGSAGGSAGGGAGGGAAGGGAAAGKVNPYDQSIASADVAIADAGHAIGKFSTGLRTAAALRVKQKIVGSRIRAVRAALKKKGLKPATRLRLTQELAQLLPEHAQLGQDRQAALAGPAPETSIDGGGGGGDEGDPNQPLIDAINAAAEVERQRIAAEEAHTQAIKDLQAEQKRTNDIATAVTATSGYQATKFFSDMISSHIVGRGVIGRSFTPGTGVEYSY